MNTYKVRELGTDQYEEILAMGPYDASGYYVQTIAGIRNGDKFSIEVESNGIFEVTVSMELVCRARKLVCKNEISL